MDGQRGDARYLFGKRVRELRAERGWSQEQFAHFCGLDRSYIGQVERGERNISLDNICRITLALRVSLAEFFEGFSVCSDGRDSA
ncbi:MAG: helix-turn-helix transcriptional regulator [Planctomycetaceae bacterium]|nr:helix-turn-helix transcriptional regulator [Planctomycetaceae bacterium]